MRSGRACAKIYRTAWKPPIVRRIDRVERTCYMFESIADELLGSNMPKLFAEKSIEIQASARRVWDVLTSRDSTAEWASEFTAGGPGLHIESDWSLDSPVLWKDRKEHVVVEGVVTAAQPNALLRFTVFDVGAERPPVSPEDGITYKLTERDGKTVLWVSQGDFSSMVDGARYRELSEEIWDRALVRIRRLAEGRRAAR